MANLAERLEAAANGRNDWLAELLKDAASAIRELEDKDMP